MNVFEAGENVTVLILPKDAFGNNITMTIQDLSTINFTVSVCYANGSTATGPDTFQMGLNDVGFISIQFVMVTSGNLLLHVTGENQTLNGSPLSFEVKPGKCVDWYLI